MYIDIGRRLVNRVFMGTACTHTVCLANFLETGCLISTTFAARSRPQIMCTRFYDDFQIDHKLVSRIHRRAAGPGIACQRCNAALIDLHTRRQDIDCDYMQISWSKYGRKSCNTTSYYESKSRCIKSSLSQRHAPSIRQIDPSLVF